MAAGIGLAPSHRAIAEVAVADAGKVMELASSYSVIGARVCSSCDDGFGQGAGPQGAPCSFIPI